MHRGKAWGKRTGYSRMPAVVVFTKNGVNLVLDGGLHLA